MVNCLMEGRSKYFRSYELFDGFEEVTVKFTELQHENQLSMVPVS